MSKSAQLRIQDVRAILQLVGECRDLGDEPVFWREHVAQRLAELTGAEFGIAGEVARSGGRLSPRGIIAWGWDNGFDQPAFLSGLADREPDMAFNPIIGAYFRLPRPDLGVCLSRKDLVTDREWYPSSYQRVVHGVAGFGHTLVSFLPLRGSGDKLSGLTVSREATARRDFTARDRVLVQEVHAALVPLIGGPLAAMADPSPTNLAPRVQQVLRCFLEGDGDKQVAVRLGLTRHTVNQYAKALYKHFGVESRTELLSLWVRRGFPGRFEKG